MNLSDKFKYGFCSMYPIKMATKMAIPCLLKLVIINNNLQCALLPLFTVAHHAELYVKRMTFTIGSSLQCRSFSGVANNEKLLSIFGKSVVTND